MASEQAMAFDGRDGWAPVKEAFLKKEKLQLKDRWAPIKDSCIKPEKSQKPDGIVVSADSVPSPTSASVADDGVDVEGTAETSSMPSEVPSDSVAVPVIPGRRGQNKGRLKSNAKSSKGFRKQYLCPSIYVADRHCRFGDKCQLQHDIDKFLAGKPADIGSKCPVEAARGRCPFNMTCRFAGSHKPDVEKSADSETADGQDENGGVEKIPEVSLRMVSPAELNTEKYALMELLRKRKYDFHVANAVVGRIPQVNRGDTKLDEEADKFRALSLVEDWPPTSSNKLVGACVDEDIFRRPKPVDRRDFMGKAYLAPLTTVGNLPFRRVCVDFGADITCEMAMSTSLLSGAKTEWSLVRRHESEKFYGVQLAGAHANACASAAQVVAEQCMIDFVDINVGCPIDSVCSKGAGSALLSKIARLQHIVRTVKTSIQHTNVGVTVKLRSGISDGRNVADTVIETLVADGCVDAITLHGRTREQRYTRACDWEYMRECAKIARAAGVPLIGCGDVLSHDDYYKHLSVDSPIDSIMIGRGALIKPWIFKEIKEQRIWDITANERLDVLRTYVNYGLDHWGSDQMGFERTRRFLLEWLSFLHRYIPIELLEVLPQKINQKPPQYYARNDLEQLMASERASDWVRITEMLLGKVPDSFTFVPKHKANAY